MANATVGLSTIQHMDDVTNIVFAPSPEKRLDNSHPQARNVAQLLNFPFKRKRGRPKKVLGDVLSSLKKMDSGGWNASGPFRFTQKHDNSSEKMTKKAKRPRPKSILNTFLQLGNEYADEEKIRSTSETESPRAYTIQNKSNANSDSNATFSSALSPSIQKGLDSDQGNADSASNLSNVQSYFNLIKATIEPARCGKFSSSTSIEQIPSFWFPSPTMSTENTNRTPITNCDYFGYSTDKNLRNSLLFTKYSSADHSDDLETGLIFRLLPQTKAAILAGRAAGLSGPHSWTPNIVAAVVSTLPGCKRLAKTFADNEIDGLALLCLDQHDLMSSLKLKLGPSVKVLTAIKTFRQTLMSLPKNDFSPDNAAVLNAVAMCFPSNSKVEPVECTFPENIDFHPTSISSSKSVSYRRLGSCSPTDSPVVITENKPNQMETFGELYGNGI